jgi:DNA-binding transcriptional LysR family regulator
MHIMHQFLAKVPFDLYELALFHLVVSHRSFTKAGEMAGLTQSAITRQIQGIETSLGMRLLERTTRSVRLTTAGELLYQEAGQLLGRVEQSLQQISLLAGGRQEIRVDVSRTVGLAYLPGFFHANLRRLPKLSYRVTCQSSSEVLSALEAHQQDLGVLCPPARLPKTLCITHKFEDAFTLVASKDAAQEIRGWSKKAVTEWLKRQNWIVIDERSNTGQRLHSWMHLQGLRIEPTMQLDNFDLIINLVALGMGVSFVPIRALALYNQRRALTRIPLRFRFTRELVVVIRKNRNPPPHLTEFIKNVLF